ncbi:hypothetical protein [uncultured Sphaerochaeta sp.]|uniref:hypothetical protein n=1 Tax=uncultured Sphaerochaeta sp. TaxID=886478 RepID=UPI0029CA42A8|nr:hypothetical protein [uncultured Sphaerochaeta sp.]
MNMLTRHAHLYTKDSKRGIICIENLHDGMVHLQISENMVKDIQSIRFRLDLGTFEHAILQDAYEHIGLEVFSIKVLVTADEDEDLDELLAEQETLLLSQGKLLY